MLDAPFTMMSVGNDHPPLHNILYEDNLAEAREKARLIAVIFSRAGYTHFYLYRNDEFLGQLSTTGDAAHFVY